MCLIFFMDKMMSSIKSLSMLNVLFNIAATLGTRLSINPHSE